MSFIISYANCVFVFEREQNIVGNRDRVVARQKRARSYRSANRGIGYGKHTNVFCVETQTFKSITLYKKKSVSRFVKKKKRQKTKVFSTRTRLYSVGRRRDVIL